jgi:iron complex outermembrane receptor protein
MKNIPNPFNFPRHTISNAVLIVCMGTTLSAWGQTLARDPKALQTVEVKGEGESGLSLRSSAAAASRLGLSLRETPASVEVIGQELIELRGARTLEEALRGAVGISVGGNPGSPGVASTRGFSGGFLTYLFNGVRVSTPTMSNRPQDSFNYERIEVFKGPASVLFGEGGIGGAINFVTKQADSRNPGSEAMVSVGSFGSLRAGVGTGGALGENSAYRLDFSRQQSDGYEDNKRNLNFLTSSVAIALAPDIKLDLALDYLRDDTHANHGTPLVTAVFAGSYASRAVTAENGRVVDTRLARKNYNVADSRMDTDSLSARARLRWALSDGWTLRNEFSYYTADRRWRNAEQHVFNKNTNLIDRDQVDIGHDHKVWGDRLDLSHEGQIAGLGNRFVGGVEYTTTNFLTQRRFSNGFLPVSVDPFNPVVGRYDDSQALTAGGGNRTDMTANIPVVSVFVENALKLTPQFTLVAGARHDRISVERTIADLNTLVNTAFTKDYTANSYRLGAVYDLSKATTFYAQLADAAAPVGTSNLLLLSASNANYPLTRGRQTEIGIKQSVAEARLDWTAALYQIEQSNVLSRDPAKPSVTVNNGQISSRGVELSAVWRATSALSLSGNLAVLDAQFDTLVEAGGVSRVGNVPTNVPKRTANLWADYRFAGTPWATGAGISYLGDAYTNNANTVRLNAHSLADAYVSYRWSNALITLRGRNLGDKQYATWSGPSAANQVILGAPRSVDLTVKFNL